MFTKEQFNNLSGETPSSSPCVSIYIPTYKAGNYQEDRLRFKNALSDAVIQLMESPLFADEQMDKKAAQKYLAAAFELLDNDEFWKYLSEGLVVFIGSDHFSYHVASIDFSPLVYVHNHYYLRPVLPILSKNERFFVLALSQNEVRFFEGNANSITPVVINDLVPNSMAELIGEADRTSNIQSHGGATGTIIYHGQGGGKDDKNENLKKYFRQIDEGLMQMLHDENPPLVIYSVDYQIPIYKAVSKYDNIHDTAVTGNPENDDPVLIHEKAWKVVKGFFDHEKEKAIEVFNQSLVNEKASVSAFEIVPAAQNGKVEILFTDKETDVIWGLFDQKNNTITMSKDKQPNDCCLLNKAAVATFKNGGVIYNIPRTAFPKPYSPINAVFRF